jgi:hypothetical protein
MDGTTFDELIKQLATTPLSRSKALRGLAASVAALAGVTLGAEPSAAKGKRKVCHCTNEKSTSCKTIEVGAKAARKHVKKHACDYRRECEDRSGCCFSDTQACTTDTQCCSGFCGDGTCRATDCASIGESCASLNCCTGTCIDGACRVPGSCIGQGTACGVGTPEPCCTGVCNTNGAGPTSGQCAPCRTGGATCTGATDTCCAGRTCTTVGAITLCCSVSGEACFGGPGQGTCCAGTCSLAIGGICS